MRFQNSTYTLKYKLFIFKKVKINNSKDDSSKHKGCVYENVLRIR